MCTEKKIDETICPLCKRPNLCKAKSSKPCWCNTIQVPKELREIIPLEFKMKACICEACIKAFQSNQREFLKDLNITSL
jgi:hypothetical protein